MIIVLCGYTVHTRLVLFVGVVSLVAPPGSAFVKVVKVICLFAVYEDYTRCRSCL